MECAESFTTLLSEFRCVFTAPSFLTFVCLMTGWVLTHRRRYVTELIWSSGSTQWGHHSCYHRFFSQAAWSLDTLCEVLAKLVVGVFARRGIIELAVDDTLCRKRGLTVYGTGMHHDPLISSRAKPLTSWGHNWVVVTLIVRCLPWAPTKVWSLPIAVRLYRNRQGLTKGKRKINPEVLRMAGTYFTYLADCQVTPEVVMGDARLSLERELSMEGQPLPQFDVLVLDVFSGDSIPAHLSRDWPGISGWTPCGSTRRATRAGRSTTAIGCC
jgi:hypothetical protein